MFQLEEVCRRDAGGIKEELIQKSNFIFPTVRREYLRIQKAIQNSNIKMQNDKEKFKKENVEIVKILNFERQEKMKYFTFFNYILIFDF